MKKKKSEVTPAALRVLKAQQCSYGALKAGLLLMETVQLHASEIYELLSM